MKIIYLHGFGSSHASGTVEILRRELPNDEVVAPDIPVDPVEALPYLEELCEREQPDLIIGTSMGGMYAQQMRGFKRICINPAFNISQHKDILREGTFEFFNQRKDGKTTFTITPEIVNHYAEMELRQFYGIDDDERERVIALFGDSDTTVNCEDIFLQYYKNAIHFHGGHRLDRQTIVETLIPLVHEFVRVVGVWRDDQILS